MTSSVEAHPVSRTRSWLAIGLFVLAVLAAVGGVLLANPWAAIIGSLGVLLPDVLRIASGWKAQRDLFNSPLYTPLRSRVLRRPALAVATVLMLTMFAAAIVGSWKIAFAAIYMFLLPLSVLLQNTRGVVALGDPVLDERQRQRRDAAYRTAYLIVVTAFVTSAVALGLATVLFGARNQAVAFAHDTGSMVLMAFVTGTAMIYLPALISAWNESDADVD